MQKATWIYDIECYKNLFYIAFYDYRNKTKFDFEVSAYKDERKEFFKVISKYDGYLASFNGLHYDGVLTKYFIREYKSLIKLSVEDFCLTMKQMSDFVISDEYEKIKKYKWIPSTWIDIDLSCYWAKSLRIKKSISLKSLGIQMGHKLVQELPYQHNKILTKEEIEDVKNYCLNNDVDITTTLFEKMKPDISLRHYIKSEYGLECWSMDAPKIASEYLLEKYCQKTYKGDSNYDDYKKSIRNYKYQPPYNWKIGDYLPEVKFKTKFFQDLYKEIISSGREFNKEFVYINKATQVKINIGIGGIHILNKNEIYEAKEGYTIIDGDVASLYPQLIENHGFLRKELQIVIDEYLALKKDRISAKREGNKTKDIFLKLVLNSFTGIADSEHNWVYSPEHLTALRVYGQLIQLRLLEELSELGIQVISNNTDGTTAIVPNELLDEYHKINNSIAKEFNITWEFAVIDKIVYANGNNYICAVSEKYMIDENLQKSNQKIYKDLDLKRKGFFKYGEEIPLGDSVNEQVIPRALELYFLKGITLEDSIKNPQKYGFHIYDYCKSNKINKTYSVWYNNEKVQNLNRYYFTKVAPYLLKKKDSKNTFDHVNVGEGVTLFNNFVEKDWEDYNINYNYYVAKARRIVDTIQIDQRQLSLF